MRKSVKALLLVMCAIVLVVATVFATLAYMTSEGTVTNTFTYGNVSITLDEAKVNELGVAVEPEQRVDNNKYKLIAGHEYTKDPTVTVADGSDNAYLFIKYSIAKNVENAIDEIVLNEDLEAIQEYPGLYVYKVTGETEDATIVKANDKIVVFNGFSVSSEADNELLAKVTEDDKIVVQAYAIQEESLDYADALKEAATKFGYINA